MLPPSNKLVDSYRHMQHELEGLYDSVEIRAMWFALLEAFFGWPVLTALQKEEDTITESEMLQLHFAVKDLKAHKPLQYITGYTWFTDLKIWVEPGVLIPRPETEELVEWIICDCKDRDDGKFSVLDIGTGSGCIALALAANLPDALVSAMDVSAGVLKVAANNARQNELDLHFFQADILDESQWESTVYDVIVSNPPYVRLSEKKHMQKNVLDYEPEKALFVSDEDPLVFYRAIMRFAQLHLADKGCLYVEINENLGEEMCRLADSCGFYHSELRTDMNDKDRMLKCVK